MKHFKLLFLLWLSVVCATAFSALPTILVDSASGSDTAASGAGPATALTGTTGVSAADGLSINLIADTPDLSGVSTIGSDVIYFVDSNAGSLNFAQITGTDNTTKVVTVANAVRASQTKGWAIGGKRASLFGTNSLKLINNNNTAGDARDGWTIRMLSGHSETGLAGQQIRRAGSTANGPLIIEGITGAATLPLLTFSGNEISINPSGGLQIYRNFEMRNSSGTKTSAKAFSSVSNPTNIVLSGLKISHSTNFYGGISNLNTTNWTLIGCEFGYTSLDAISNSSGSSIINCYFHDMASGKHGIIVDSHCTIFGCIIARCGGDGIRWTAGIGTIVQDILIANNTIDSCGSDGIEFTATSMGASINIVNNILSNNTAYGLNLSNAALTDILISSKTLSVVGNNTYGNGTNAYNSGTAAYAYNTCPWASGDPGLNPTFTSASTGDFTITNANLIGKGYPASTVFVGGTSITRNYSYPGAAQPPTPTPGGGETVSFF